MIAFLPFATTRLRLRSFLPHDAPAFAAYRSDPDVARYQSWATPYSLADAARLATEMRERADPVRGDWLQIAVDLDGELVGDVAVGLDPSGRVATIGYTLAPRFQRRGLAVEAAGAVVDRLFAVAGVHRVDASIDGRNLPSSRVLQRLGFERVGVAPGAVWADGERVEDVRYGLDVGQHAAWAARSRSPS